VAKIDSSENKKAHEKYKVKGYPSIKYFPRGDKLDGEFEDYDGAREATSMVSWVEEMKRKLRPLFLEQLTNQK
jgi:protein disulfide-isomerase A6